MHIFISAGESSGDLYGSLLAKHLLEEQPGICLTGLGGSRMAEAGVKLQKDMTHLAVTGFVEVMGHLQDFISLKNQVVEHLNTQKPDLIVLIDYPGFHFAIIKAVAHLKIPIIYYISPQVWAWHKRRIKIMREHLAKILVIFPFEQEFFEKAGIPVEFVGHPLLDILPLEPPQNPEEILLKEGFDPTKPLLTLMPGSRYNEIKRIFPVMVETVQIIRKSFPKVQVLVPVASTLEIKHFRGLYNPGDGFIFHQNTPYSLRQCSTLCLTASGTATVENALLKVPMVIMYRLASISYWLAKRFTDIHYIGMVNIICKEMICPELIQDEATSESLAEKTLEVLKNPQVRERQLQGFDQVRQKCGNPGASQKAAQIILQFLNSRRTT